MNKTFQQIMTEMEKDTETTCLTFLSPKEKEAYIRGKHNELFKIKIELGEWAIKEYIRQVKQLHYSLEDALAMADTLLTKHLTFMNHLTIMPMEPVLDIAIGCYGRPNVRSEIEKMWDKVMIT